jgi:hypothetical protein
VSERADAAVYPVRSPVSMPRHRVLVPPGRANPLHHRPRRSPPNRRAARRRCPRLAVPPDAAVYAHELMPHRHPRTGEACHVFPSRLPCTGEVIIAVQACRARVGRAGPGRGPRALRWPRPSRTRLGHARTAQAGCAGTVQLGRARIRLNDI